MNKIKIIPQNIFFGNPKFIFIHIPKAAGSSIQKWIHKSLNININTNIDWNGFNLSNSHKTAKEYNSALEKQYYDFFKFSFVRNPWDRMLSFHRWVSTYSNNKLDFSTWIKTHYNGNTKINKWVMKTQLSYIEDNNGKIIIDFVAKFENLYEDLSYISKKINIPLPKTMFHENSTKHRNYKEMYTEETKNIIASIFKKDIKKFNYKYE